MTDTESLPQLPAGWCWTTIGETGNVITGGTPSKEFPENYGNYISFVKPPELNDCVITSAKDNLSEEGASVARILPPESVLVSCIGRLGKTGINKIPVAFNQQINAIIFYNGVLPKYGFYYSQTIKNHLYSVASATTLPIVNKSKFQSIPFILPPLPEQHRIVQKIEELFTDLDAGVQALEKAKVQIKNYRRAVLKAAVEGRLTEEWRNQNSDIASADMLLNRIKDENNIPQAGQKRRIKKFQLLDDNTLPILPKGWIWTRLDFIADIKGGITKDSKRKVENSREIPYLRVANVQRGYLDLSEIKYIEASETVISELILKYGDVLFTEGGDRDKLGRGWVWQNELPECIHQNHIFRARLYSEEIFSKFISWFANTHAQYFMDIGKQTTNLASINLTKLSEFPVSLPPTEEQKVIVSEIERRFSVIDQIEKTIDQSLIQAKKLRQSILKKAFEGKLVPQHPNDEPASVLLEKIKQEKGRAEVQKKPGNGKKVKAETIIEVSGKTKQAELF